MSASVLRAVWMVLAAALAAAFSLAWSGDVDTAEHDRYTHALRASQELDARVNEEVAKSRLGIVNHYDGLVRIGDELASVEAELERLPPFLAAEGAEPLRVRVEAYRDARREKEALVESFKTEQSVLRNSLRAFPHNSDRVLRTLRQDESLNTVVGALERLERSVMLATLVPTRDVLARARCDLAALGAGAVRGCEVAPVAIPPEAVADVTPVLQHGRIIVERLAAVEELVSRIMTLPVGARSAALFDSYGVSYQRAYEASRTRWSAVFALSVAVLVLGAALIIKRLKASTAALGATTEKLGEALQALRHERDREVELANLKSRFVSMTSHEFRTPLSVILSSAELLEAYWERWPTEKRELHLRRVQDGAKGMSRMLDGVLLIGRAEAGMLELNPQPLRLEKLCDQVVEDIRAGIGAERLLEYANDAGEREVWMDEKLLRHILTNLLSNAFKYSPDDRIVRFDVRLNAEAALFEIADEGIGIPEEELGSLFEAFHRCSNASELPGNGLGLAVVKKSVEVHGGTIEVDSRAGKGTRFSVRIPFEEEPA